ncbi:CU044_5270 family protein [Streptosporangium fragile]|uniref:CU044_5270 family protein n=1 Tax=Streptosporangium fragile TaxID=46186 RepID=A0ABN3W763_9ACTN
MRPDGLLDDAYRRRRDADLARAFAEAPSPRSTVLSRLAAPWSRLASRSPMVPRLLVAGALAGLAAVTVIPAATTGTAVLGGPGGDATPSLAEPVRSAAPVTATLDARTFLLAGAETVAGQTALTGRYWYERTRTFEPTDSGAVVAHTGEVWYDGRGGRSSSNQDVEVTFAEKADEAAWKAKGSPSLWPDPKTQEFSGMILKTGIGKKSLTLDDERNLPGDVRGMEQWLRSAHQGGSFPVFVFDAARHILSSPATPAARSAVLRVLADQPGITLERGVKDPLGRTGVAVTTAGGDIRLIVDESGASLLAFEYNGPDEEPRTADRAVFIPARKGLKVAYESSGWVGKLGARP